ncbi:MAG: AEC family transporter [Candidatus Uhrbacteria bacterium]
MFPVLLATIVPTFGLVIIGWFCRRRGIFNRETTHGLNAYAYYIALPALIFESVFAQAATLQFTADDLRFLLGLAVSHLIVFAIAAVMLHRAKREVRALGPMLVSFGATAYLGIPFATFAFGEKGTAYAAMGSSVLVVLLLLASLVNLNRYASRTQHTTPWHRLLELPFLWVVLAGIALPLIGINQLPDFLSRTIAIIAGSAGPTALLALGAFNYDIKLKRIPWRWTIPIGVAKVVLPTLTTFGLLSVLGVTGLRLVVGTTLAATSIAVTAFVLAEEYDIGRELTSGAVVISTIVSLLTLAAIMTAWISTDIFTI